MTAEFQVPSPLVLTRETYFARYCKQQADGSWAVVDISLDSLQSNPPARCSRRASGCLSQEMPNGYSKVTWVEHAEVDDRGVHNLYKHMVGTGHAFGAKRWVAIFNRQCERLASVIATNISSGEVGVITNQEGRRSMLKLAERMVISFCAGVSASTAHTWTTLSGIRAEVVRVMTRKSVDDPGRPPGIVLSTSFWIPVPPKRVFDFLRDENSRNEWDILSNGGVVQQMAHIANGRETGNCVSLLRVNSANSSQSNMLILQESCTDPTASFVIYAPVDIVAMNMVLNEGDPDYVTLLPSGFAILPDAMIDGEPSLKELAKEPTSILSLPDDLLETCLARVSRSYYPTLSLVSKRFRSLIASPELYKTRSLLNRTENCLYVCLQFPPDPNPKWFTLYRKLDKSLLVQIPILNSPPMEWSSLVGVDHYLYAIGGNFKGANIPFLNCRTHTWLEAPSMRLTHQKSKFDGDMYLAGSYENPESLNGIEVFNTKTQTWNLAGSGKRNFNLINMEGKIYKRFNDKSCCVVKPKDWTIEYVGLLDRNWPRRCCVIDNIIYIYNPSGVFEWYDSTNYVGLQINLVDGLEGLPKFDDYSIVKLANYGGKMLVLWDRFVSESERKEKMIWCAKISLEKRGSKEILGKVEWVDVVLTVPSSYNFVYASVATF